MSFTSLKKSTPLDRPKPISADQFIDDAVNYAYGVERVRVNTNVLKAVAKSLPKTEKMNRFTFTLDKASADSLSQLSERTGIPRSRIIRILTQRHVDIGNDCFLLESRRV